VDLTFSAPKSFSIQMLVYAQSQEKQSMEIALKTAVNNTLKYIEEKEYVVARKGHNGVIKEPINKLTFATFMHTTNRNVEPQAHVHCLLVNAAKCDDGKFRSIAFDEILRNNKFFGQIFRNELALETKKLGFEITPTILSDGSSSFELSKIDNKLIEAFSTRRKEIEELCKLYNVTTKSGRDNIVINSRKSKSLSPQEDIVKAWRNLEQKVQQEITQEKLLNEKIEDNTHHHSSRNFNLEDLVKLCVEDITQHKSVFTKEELAKKILKFSMGNHNIREIDNELKTQEAQGMLIKHSNQYTSKALLTQEKEIIKHAQNSISKANPLIEEKYFAAHYEKFTKRELAINPEFQMNKQQQIVTKHILSSKDNIITIVGLPGVGKSTVLDSVRNIADHKVNKIIRLFIRQENFEGMAPTASAAKTLGSAAKIESNTIHHFIGKYQGYLEGRGSKESLQSLSKNFKNTIIFVDEASLMSTNVMHKLTTLQSMLKFKMVLVGDTKQLAAVEAGKTFEQILSIIKPIELKQIVRQKDEAHKQAIIAASGGKVKETFVIHDNNILETKDLASDSTTLYMQGTQEKRANTLLISPTRALRDAINNQIRLELQEEGSLAGSKKSLTVLRQKDLSKADARFIQSYQIGNILKFNKAYKNNIEKDESLRVKKLNSISNSLILAKENGKEALFYLKPNIDYSNKFIVFTEQQLRLQENLKIIFTKNNKEFGLINSETAIIKQINNNNAVLQFENNISRSVPLSALKHIDYGYCITVHSSQGKTYANTIAAINNHPLLNEQKSWLVTLSRHKDKIKILTQGKHELEKTLSKNDGQQMSAIELKSLADSKIQESLKLNQINDNQNISKSAGKKFEMEM
jgi:conjugative relaxase-like TrwC/TraI family protein